MTQTCQYSIGIDVGKESLVVQVMQGSGEGKVFKTESTSWSNGRTGYRKMFSWLKQEGITGWESRMVMEATGLDYPSANGLLLIEGSVRTAVEQWTKKNGPASDQ